jgi:dipeptidyl aminopeptidase/acylaminoacyl peptidase
MAVQKRSYIALIMLLTASIACSVSLNTGAPNKQETAQAYAEQTIAARPTNTPVLPAALPSSTPTPQTLVPNLFNHPLYYLSKDGDGLTQLYRMEVDGKTTSQVISAPGGISDYDVSQHSGLIAYVTDNDLMILRPDDPAPIKVLDEIPQDGSDGFYEHHAITYPVWSHDGNSLAFHHTGLVIYYPASGEMKTLLQNQIEEGDFSIVRELYIPEKWSPDDSKLLLNITYYESGTAAIYHMNTGQVVKLTKGDQSSAMGSSAWTEDSTQVYIAGYSYGGESSDMWMFDANTGAPFEFIPVHAPENRYNLAQFPSIFEGKVYFFYDLLNTYPQNGQTTRLAVSSPAIPAKPEFIRADGQDLVDVLWAEDATFALGLQRTSTDEYPYYGNLQYIPVNGQPSQIILSNVRMAKWGR